MISVVVCTYNRADILSECLTSLTRQTVESTCYEVIVVNNNSTDNTDKVAAAFTRSYSNFKIINEHKQGLSHSRNRGWQEAKGNYVAFIDDDAKASPDWCEKIISAFRHVEPSPVAVGGQCLPWYKTEKPNWFEDDYERRSWGDESGFLQVPRARYGFSGSNMAFKREILVKFGGFSADYGVIGDELRLGEETELFNRIYETEPWFWYDPSIVVFHLVPEEKMKVSYRLNRAFAAGESMVGIHGVGSMIATFKLLANMLIKMSMLPCAVLTKPSSWQKRFLANAIPVASGLGSLKATVARYFVKTE